MSKKPIEIHIDMDRNCDNCGKGGATPSGYCMACVAKMIKAGKFDHIIKEKKMAKTMQNEVEKTEQKDEIGVNDRPPIISSIATIKEAKIKPACGELSYNGFDFTPNQYQQIADWVKDKVPLMVTMQPLQRNLPGMDGG